MGPRPAFVTGVVPVAIEAALVGVDGPGLAAGSSGLEAGRFKQLVLAKSDERTKSIKGNHHLQPGSTVN